MGRLFKRALAWFFALVLFVNGLGVATTWAATKDVGMLAPGLVMLVLGGLWCAHLYRTGKGYKARNPKEESQATTRVEVFTEVRTPGRLKEPKPPISPDQKWAELQQEAMDCAKDGMWGLYSNVLREQAEFLRKEGKARNAFDTYSRVLYLDVNGASNAGNDKAYWADSPPFDLEFSMVAPMIYANFVKCAEQSGLHGDARKEAFIASSKRMRNKNIPIGPEAAWDKILDKVLRA